mmetsp:Transcript_51800/g.155451  ORF Transcript_51800/g.155451 Transcript_51800/m.155451 type:complete len:249 (-) Transcript_51800:254-1000(-)
MPCQHPGTIQRRLPHTFGRLGVPVPPQRRGGIPHLGDQFVRTPHDQVAVELDEAVQLVQDRLGVGGGVGGGRGRGFGRVRGGWGTSRVQIPEGRYEGVLTVNVVAVEDEVQPVVLTSGFSQTQCRRHGPLRRRDGGNRRGRRDVVNGGVMAREALGEAGRLWVEGSGRALVSLVVRIVVVPFCRGGAPRRFGVGGSGGVEIHVVAVVVALVLLLPLVVMLIIVVVADVLLLPGGGGGRGRRGHEHILG